MYRYPSDAMTIGVCTDGPDVQAMNPLSTRNALVTVSVGSGSGLDDQVRPSGENHVRSFQRTNPAGDASVVPVGIVACPTVAVPSHVAAHVCEMGISPVRYGTSSEATPMSCHMYA